VSGGSYLIFEQTLQTQVAAGSQQIIIDNQLISVSLVTVAKPSMFWFNFNVKIHMIAEL